MLNTILSNDEPLRPLYVAEVVHDAGGYSYAPPRSLPVGDHPLDVLARCESRLLELARKTAERHASIEPKGAA